MVIITESKKGLGLPGEQIMPDSPLRPIDMKMFDGRQVIEHVDESQII